MSEAQLKPVGPGIDTADPEARSHLFATLYAELHQLARSALRRNGPQLTLSPTTLLHEAYLNIARRGSLQFPDAAHFMAYASRAMRGLIIDFARERQAQKRGADFEITGLSAEVSELPADDIALTQISDALDELSSIDTRLAELVDLRFFCGFSFAEIAAMRCMSERTAQRDWEKAKMLLHLCIGGPDTAASPGFMTGPGL